MTLEVKAPKAEVVDPSVEKGKETAPEADSTVDVTKTPEFKKALDTALGKSTASLQAQVSISKQASQAAEAKIAVAEATQTKTAQDIAFLKQKLTDLAGEQFAGDSEAMKGYKNTLAIELREMEANAREETQNLRDAEQERNRVFLQLGEKAREIKGKREVPEGILESCTSVEQMDNISKHFPEVGEKKESESKKVEETEKENEFDSNTSTESGDLPEHPTNEQLNAVSTEGYAKWYDKYNK